ncbi:MAG: GTPase Era [Alphaproteobacteria bacterium]
MTDSRAPSPADHPAGRHCGFVALVGAPNVGKSTLVNRLAGARVSIVSPKAQTTRTRVLAIRMVEETQIVFVDTPGIFQSSRRFERAMVDAAWRGAADADLVVCLLDARHGLDAAARNILDRLAAAGRTVSVAINKVDLVKPAALLPLTARLAEQGLTDIWMISALHGDGVAEMVAGIAGRMPAGPWLYPPDQLTDMTDRLTAAEVTREKVFHLLHDELPYAIAVETETWEDFRDGSVRIGQIIFVERENQRPIVLGKGGQMVRRIRTAAQRDLEAMFDRRVHLFLHIKTAPRWRDDPDRYRDMGLDLPPPEPRQG